MSVQGVTVHEQSGRKVKVKVVDCDVHPQVATEDALAPFLPARWKHLTRKDPRIPWRLDMTNDARRADSRPDNGGPPASDPAFLKRQLLDEGGVDYAIMIPTERGTMIDAQADAVRHAAVNEWIADAWLSDGPNWHGRYFGSIRVPMQNPEAAVAEIHKWAGDPRWVQIMIIPSYTPVFGHAMYEPVWRAAVECGLPICSHASNTAYGVSNHHVAPTGTGAHFFDYHAMGYPSIWSAHLASMICSGVFARHPELRFVVLESGISWSMALADHLDRQWRRIRDEVPEVTELPSFYMNRNVLFGTQPIEEPEDAEALRFVYEQIHAERRIVFSTDYPHFDYDEPGRALSPLPKDMRSRILGETALELYDMPVERWEPEAES